MDLSCIILSGDLELYVLGMLPEDEAYKIQQLASLFSEVQEEIDRISESLEGFAATSSVAPSPSVKDNLMSKLRELKAEEDDNRTPVVPLITEQHHVEESASATPVIPIGKRNNRSALLAAAVIGLVLSIGGIIYLSSQNKYKNQELANLHQQVNRLSTDLSLQQQNVLAYSQTLQMMQSDDYRKINLTNVPGKPDALAQVFWNKKTNEVYIADVSLPTTPAAKQYQLWAIVNGKPVDAGLLQNKKQQAQRMKAFEKADAFAITLEQKGGSPTPTLEAMYVMGKVS